MKVLLLSKSGQNLDEGMKKFGMRLLDHLNECDNIEARLFDTTAPISRKNLDNVVDFSPDIIHLIVGPTNRGLTLLKLISTLTRSKSVATCIHPDIPHDLKWLFPDLMFVQTKKHERRFSECGSVEYLPAGIDTEEFSPKHGNKSKIADRFDLSDHPVFLHVGHIKSGRRVQDLAELTQYGDVFIVGSPSTNPDQNLIKKLEKQGCNVCTEFLPDIASVYNAADIYVFPPVEEGHSILMPFSVLEAMACNLPVLTAPFGALPQFFEEGNGLKYIDDVKSIGEDDVEQVQQQVKNRERVMDKSWKDVTMSVVRNYEKL